MKILWLTTTHNGLESIIGSLKRVLWTNVSSMMMEPHVTGLAKTCEEKGFEFQEYRYDEGKEAQFHYDGEVDHNIRRKVKEYHPEIIIYSGPAAGKCRPQVDTLLSLKENARTLGYVLDGGCPEWHPVLEEYKSKNVFDVTVNTDGNSNWPQRIQDMTLWQPTDESFYPPGGSRSTDGRYQTSFKDIRFGFAGGAGSKHRREAITSLQTQAGLVVAERFEQWGTYNRFSDFMLRCKMTINFPETGSGKAYHLKNRVIESGWAHCCLFEKKNDITPQFFEPNVDYVEYRDIEEAIERVLFMPDSEIDKFAGNLYNKVKDKYTARQFWGQILDAVAK